MKYLFFISSILFFSCQTQGNAKKEKGVKSKPANYQDLAVATFAGGCFWCVEASFEQIEGVTEAISGYAGGKKETANYQMVGSGVSGHAEVVQVFYDAAVIDYETLLDIFFIAHDPTQLNRQGPDVGTQYRSEIFYHNEEQKKLALAKMEELASSFNGEIVTKISKLDTFYKAEEYHQDYEEKHPYNGYIVAVSRPKIEKVAKKFKDRLKAK